MEEMKPYTLRLADDVDAVATIYPDMEEVSDELRRLHGANTELMEALRMWLDIHDTPAGFAGKYGKAFDAAIAAQQLRVDAAASAARLAIAKATGQSK